MREQQRHLGQAAQLHLAQDTVLLGVTGHGFDELAGKLTDLISGVARRASIDAARSAGDVLRDVRRDVDLMTVFSMKAWLS